MSENPEEITTSLLDKIYRAEQIDMLHLSLINLLDMVKDGEIDLVLDQNGKTFKQKAAFIDKIIEAVESKELKDGLLEIFNIELEDTNQEMNYFREKYLGTLLRNLQEKAEKFTVVRLTLAKEFKDTDLREMVLILEKKIEKRVALEITVDSSLIGGAVIQFGTYISDYSLKSRLDQFRAHWRSVSEAAQV
jgi:F-type H+-transporting ATPase subunit delta